MALEITDSNYKEVLAEGKPVVVVYDAAEQSVYLLADCSAKEALHCE